MHTTKETVIPPQSIKKVPVMLKFAKKAEVMFVEQRFMTHWSEGDIYTTPHSLVNREESLLQVSDFSNIAI